MLETVSSLLVLGLGAVLLWTGLTKMGSLGGLAAAVDGYQIVPAALVLPAAVTLAGCEVGLGIGLLLHGRSPVVCLAAAGLLAIFALGQVTVLARGCFGTGEPVSYRTVGRTLGLAVAAALPLISRRLSLRHTGTSPAGDRR